jgi:hypothetical protein
MILPHRPDRKARRGLAPIELVIALPMLLLMAAFIYKLADAGLIKASVNIKARRAAWAQRSPNAQAENNPLPGPPASMAALRTAGSNSRGLSRTNTSRELNWAPLLAQKSTIQAAHAVLGDPWDHHTVGFESRGRFEFDTRLSRVAAGLPTSLDALKNPANVVGGGGGKLLEALAKMAVANTKLGEALTAIDKIKEAKKKAKKKGGILGTLESIGEAVGGILGVLNPGEWKKILDAASAAKGLMKNVNRMLDIMKGDAPY